MKFSASFSSLSDGLSQDEEALQRPNATNSNNKRRVSSLTAISDDASYVSEDFSPRSLVPKVRGKGQSFGGSAYHPGDDGDDGEDEPGSSSETNSRQVSPQKRNLGEEVSSVKSDDSPLKKQRPEHKPSSSTPEAKTMKTQPNKVNNPPPHRGSISSVKTRRRAPSVIDDRNDRNYVFDNSNSDEEDREIEELEKLYNIPAEERANVLFDFDRERDKRLAVMINIPKNMYTEQEKSLFLQLAMRGFEPLAPKHWQFDFPTLPDSLFPEEGKKKAEPIIKLSRSTTFHAIKSLMSLFSLSGRVRDCGLVEKRPEGLIKQNIKRYIRWALYDVNLEIGPGSLPVHVLHAQRRHESVLNALERLNKRLKRLAVRHQRALKSTASNGEGRTEAPLLIGFIICGPVVAIMAFDVSLLDRDPDLDGKFISQFDLSERGQDVWNSLSLAIVIMHIRNTMVRLSEDNYGGYFKSEESAAASDDL
ncbi:hypothetical protein BJY04DRAFT_212508 [Aspergillus karnatakaensis]|uniref:uncharacterized protein n=1 Tax=Aspergillus karnatakaensis TaxID=1810916 RepID=UPI003CCE53C2